MSRAGLNELLATSLVGAMIAKSAEWRSFRISAVIIMPAASVLFAFFLAMSSINSVIMRIPVSGSYAPKIDATKSVDHLSDASPNVG